MNDEPNEDLLKKLVEGEQIITIPSDISISVKDESSGEREYIYPEEVSSAAMVSTTAANLGVELRPAIQEKFIESIEEVKGHRLEEFEFELGLPKIPLAKVRVKLSERRKIKRYTEIKEEKGRKFNQK